MGNNICCEDTHQGQTAIEQEEQKIIKHINIVEGKDHVQHKPASIIHEKEKQRPETEDLVPELPKIQLPQLWPRVSEVVNAHRFFQHQLSALTQPQRRKYGLDVYQGQLDEVGVKPHGLGRMFKQDGSLYVGFFSNGRAHGRGAFIFHNGYFYEGEFNNNKAETSAGVKGHYESQHLKYVGGFRNNTFDGFGVETGDNYRFQGHYEQGVRKEGELKWKALDGNYAYTGPFNAHNNFHGKGKLVEPQGTYEGSFVDGLKHGDGFYSSKNGTKYQGQYANNQRNGKGKVFNSDGSVAYEGEIKDGLPHGKGSVKNGDTFIEAIWVEGIDATLIAK